MKHADDVRTDTESWPAVEKKVRRAHAQRVAGISMAVVVLIAAAAVLIPRLGTHARPHGFVHSTTPAPTPSSKPTVVSPAQDKTTHIDPLQGWLAQYPSEWRATRFESGTDFVPRGLPSVQSGRTTFSVVVALEGGDYRSPYVLGGANSTRSHSHTEIGGVPAERFDIIDKSGKNSNVVYQLDWSGRCAPTWPACTSHQMLVVWVSSYEHALWTRYKNDGLAIARSIVPLADARGRMDRVATRSGSTYVGFALDDFSKALIGFLDARAEQGTAETYMCCEAPTDYNNLHGLYQYGGKIFSSYRITDRGANGDPNKASFGVTITYEGGFKRTELIEVDRTSPGQAPKIATMCNTCGGL